MDGWRWLIVSCFFLGLLALSHPAVAQVPASQSAGGMVERETEMDQYKRLEEKTEKQGPSGSEVIPENTGGLSDEGPKVFIGTVVVEGVELLSDEEISAIVAPFGEKELSFKQMQKVADLITDEYRKKGYVTSRAYMPPQKIRDGVLTVRVVEGKAGDVEIKGNKYFSSALLKKKLEIEPSGYFDYSALQQALIYINESPDREASAILVPGRGPGTTDIILEVEDHLPVHVGFSYDNYGSRFIEKNRFGMTLEHNNLTGHDDKLFIKGQASEANHLLLQQARYVYPLTSRFELGGHVLFSQLELGREFKDLDAEGDARIFGLFSNYAVVEEDNLEAALNLGFDAKDITNQLSGTQISRDELSVAKAGFELDAKDPWGRTILTAEVNGGIPDFLGSMSEEDPDASRAGAGGEFIKGVSNLFRLQPMPLSTSMLVKNSFQWSGDTLTASEQFQIGGPTSVRGYPPGELSGDKGFYSSVEWSLPMYGLSQDIRIPLRKEKIYDAFRFVLFGDVGMVNFNDTRTGESESGTLRAAGFGGRFTVADELECRVEVGYPLGGKDPSDGDQAHTWVEFHLKI
jgi:hemolysin activation/secretion protein